MVRRRRIKDRSWRIGGSRFSGKPCAIRLVEPNGKYLILERLHRAGVRKKTPEFYKMDLKEGGVIDTTFIEPGELLKIIDKPWAKKMDITSFRRKVDNRMRDGGKDLFDSNLWRDDHKPLFSPGIWHTEEYDIPFLIIDDGKYVLTEVEREGEEGEAEDGSEDIEGGYFLAVREIKSTGKPVEIDLDWPWRIRRNKHKARPDALGTLHSKDTYAIIFDGKRIINVFRSGEKIRMTLEFGYVPPSNCLRWRQGNLQFHNDIMMWMGFNQDGSRLLTVSYLPYGGGPRRASAYHWEVKSWDIDGRLAEMARTRSRLDGKWKIQSERKSRSDALTKAGLPWHVAELMARNRITDTDGIELFRYLRQGGILATPENKEDPIAQIDEMAFTGAVGKEDARFLVENREHVELIRAISKEELDVDYARWLLVERGFSGHPDAVRRILGGAEVNTVAMIEGIKDSPTTKVTKSERPKEESRPSDNGIEESDEDSEDEWFSSDALL